MFYLYIIKSLSLNGYYIGITKNIVKRMEYHNGGKARSTKGGRLWQLVHEELFKTRSATRKREIYLKSLKKRAFLEKLIKHF